MNETEILPPEPQTDQIDEIVTGLVRVSDVPVTYDQHNALVEKLRADMLELYDEIQTFLNQASDAIKPITCQQDLEQLVSLVTRSNTLAKRSQDAYRPYKQSADRMHQMICRFEHGFVDPLIEFKQAADVKFKEYQRELDRKAREAALAAQQAAEEAAKRQRERLLREAARDEAKGNLATSEAKLEAAEQTRVPIQPVIPESPKVKGFGIQPTWKARCINKAAFLQTVIEDANLLGYVIVDEAALTKTARNLKGQIKWAGIQITEDIQTRTGRERP